MTCAEFQELVAMVAMDALDKGESAAADAHLAEPAHQGCIEALARAQSGAGGLAWALAPQRPPPGLWALIEARLPARTQAPRGLARYREPLAWAAAAAAVVALFLLQGARKRELGVARAQQETLARELQSNQRRVEECRRDVEALRGEGEAQRTALSLLQSPSARLVPLSPTPGTDATAHASALIDVARQRGVVLTGSGQLRVPAGKVAELWLIRGKSAPVPAGLLRASASGALLAEISPALLSAGAPDALAISFEPGPGPSSTPTTVVLVGAMPKS